MRCQKCGFVSFDYLTECKKCGVDLTATRDLLGYLSIKPSSPFFLEAILANRAASPVGSAAGIGAAVDAANLSLADMELEDDLAFDIDFSTIDDAPKQASQQRSPAISAGETDSDLDFFKDLEKELTMELSDDNLTASIQSDEASEGIELTIDFSLEESLDASANISAAQMQEGQEKSGEPSQEANELQELSISESDLDGLFLSVETDNSLQGESKDSMNKKTPPGDAIANAAADKGQTLDGNIEIEIGADDLENLLIEFDDAPAKKE